MQRPHSLNLWQWYKGLPTAKKVMYPFLVGVLYGVSVVAVIMGYWAKSRLDYNIFSVSGWHAFSGCVAKEIDRSRNTQI